MDQLDRLENLLTDNQDDFCKALHRDFGKPPFEQLFEITVPLENIKYCKENLQSLMAPERVPIPKGLEATGNKGPCYCRTCCWQPSYPETCQNHSGGGRIVCRAYSQIREADTVSVVTGDKEEITELLQFPFDFIFSPEVPLWAK